MKKIIKILVFCALYTCAPSLDAQNNSGNKGLVDSRVTLDDSKLNAEQEAVPSQRKKQTKQPNVQTPTQNGAKDSLFMANLPSDDGETHVTAKLDTDSITIGDQTTLHIYINGCNGKKVTIPTFEEFCKLGIEALESESDTTVTDDGKGTTIEQRITITSFDAGSHYIYPIVIRIDDGSRTVMLAPADSLRLNVYYVPEADTVKCVTKADADYINEPYTFWEIARWVVYSLLFAMVVAAIVWIVKRRKEHKPIVILPGAKPLPADQRAIKELESLRRKELWQKGKIKRYYTDLTDIIRRFLRNMYGISASEMTTRQTLRAFHSSPDWSEESETLLQQLLQKADMVKFAKMEPESYEHDQAMQFALDFVRKVAETHKLNNPEKEENK